MKYLKAFETTITDNTGMDLIFAAFPDSCIFWGGILCLKEAPDQVKLEHINFINHPDVKAVAKRKLKPFHVLPARQWLISKCNEIHNFEQKQLEYLEKPVSWESRYTGIHYDLANAADPPQLSIGENSISLIAVGLQKIIISEEKKENIHVVDGVFENPVVHTENANLDNFTKLLHDLEVIRSSIENIISITADSPCFLLPNQIEWDNGEKLFFWYPSTLEKGINTANTLLAFFKSGNKRLEGTLGYMKELFDRISDSSDQNLLSIVSELKLIDNPIEKQL